MKKKFIPRFIIILIIIVVFKIIKFNIDVNRTPLIAIEYAENKYAMKMNFVNLGYKYFPDEYFRVNLSPEEMPDFVFYVKMDNSNLKKITGDSYYKSYYQYLSENYIREEIECIFGTKINMVFSDYGSYYDKESEIYFYPTMTLEEMEKYFEIPVLRIYLDKIFDEKDFDEEAMKIFETIEYINKSFINIDEVIIQYRGDENNITGFGFSDMRSIISLEQVKEIMIQSISR